MPKDNLSRQCLGATLQVSDSSNLQALVSTQPINQECNLIVEILTQAVKQSEPKATPSSLAAFPDVNDNDCL